MKQEIEDGSGRGGACLLLLYAMTGGVGLLAEQGIEKYTALLVGVTASASAVVLFTYFLGFALGGFVAARFLRRGLVSRPLRAYGLVELAVGSACVAFTYAFHPAMVQLAPLQNIFTVVLAKQLVRFASASVLILPIAALMGASFPLVAQALDNRDSSGPQRWSIAYSANLIGAVLAAALAPYFVLPYIGLRGVMWLCFVICASVAATTQLLTEPAAPPAAAQPAAPTGPSPLDHDTAILLLASFLSGLIFFALEVIWTHLIGTVVGASVYAFSSMLTMVLIGLWIGAAWVNRGRPDRPLMPAWLLFALCTVALLLQFKAWESVWVLFVLPGPAVYRNFYTREFYRLVVAGLLIVPPAALLGMIYPRLLRSPIVKRDGNARLAGYLSATNSLGCLLGALAATFVLVPWLGSETSLKAIVCTLAALALLFLARESRIRLVARVLPAALIAASALLSLRGHWDWLRLTSGTPVYFGEWTSRERAGQPHKQFLVFRHEHIQGGFTTVVDSITGDGPRARTVRSLFTNGKVQGTDNQRGEFGHNLDVAVVPTMFVALDFGIAALPAMFVDHFDRALLIGLGTGQSAYLLRQFGFRQVDIAEFSPGIVLAAETSFEHVNHGVLRDPSVRLILEDGRNLLLTQSAQHYNLITVELSTIWFSGATNLYSKEFYQLARRRLAPGGVLQQWVQLHRIGPDEIGSAVATARAVFPFVAYWTYGGQGMLVASDRPLAISAQRNATLAARLARSPDLAPQRARQIIDEISRGEVLSCAGVDRLVAQCKPVINTDHNRYIEYATPRYSSSQRDWRAYNLAFLRQWNR